jgi:hypothetical protein
MNAVYAPKIEPPPFQIGLRMTSGFSKKAKTIIGIINLAVIIAAGVASAVLYRKWNELSWIRIPGAELPVILLIIGAGLAVISAIVGLLSLCKCSHKKCTCAYVGIILVVVIVEILGIAMAYIFQDALVTKINDVWNEVSDSKIVETRKLIERKLECCGWSTKNRTESDCGWEDATNDTIGCEEAVKEQVKSNAFLIAVALIVLVVIEALLLVAAIYLLCQKEQDEGGVTKF